MDAYEAAEAQKVHDIQTGTKALLLVPPIGLLLANTLLYLFYLMHAMSENREYRRFLAMRDSVWFPVEPTYTPPVGLLLVAGIMLGSAVLTGFLIYCWRRQVKQLCFRKRRVILLSMPLILISIVVLGYFNILIQSLLFL